MSPERPTVERPPWEPRSRREMEGEVAQEQALRRKLGDTVGWIVDTLLLDEGEATDDASKTMVQKRKREALECLAYVRDVLKGTVTEVEDDRLLGEEEAKRRREKEKRAKEAAEALSRKNSTPHPPRPAAIPIEARPQGVGARRSQDYFMPHASGSSPPTKAAIPVPIPVIPPTQASRPPPIPVVPAPASVPSALSPSLTPKSSTSTFNAPWNYTRSAFSSSDSPIATLPRVPPRTSAVLPIPRAQPLPASFMTPPPTAAVAERPNPVSRDQKPKRTPYDPLGAIP